MGVLGIRIVVNLPRLVLDLLRLVNDPDVDFMDVDVMLGVGLLVLEVGVGLVVFVDVAVDLVDLVLPVLLVLAVHMGGKVPEFC